MYLESKITILSLITINILEHISLFPLNNNFESIVIFSNERETLVITLARLVYEGEGAINDNSLDLLFFIYNNFD